MSVERKSGQPKTTSVAKESRAARPRERTPIDGRRDILSVMGLKDDLHYHWVADTEETGARIFEFKEAGYEFVESKAVRIGQNSVYNSDDEGSIIRKPTGDGRFQYLMCIPKEWYDEDQEAKQKVIKDEEKQMLRPRNPNNESDDGQYGENKIKYY